MERLVAKRRFDPNIERVLYWGERPDHFDSCPRCSSSLVRDYQTFALVVEQLDGEHAFFFAGGRYGRFCPGCPTVVVDSEELMLALRAGMKNVPFQRWTVLGLVDLDSWPEDKLHLPLAEVQDELKVTIFSDHLPLPDSPKQREKPDRASRARGEGKRRKARRKRERKKANGGRGRR